MTLQPVRTQRPLSELGFTLIELIVTIAIAGLLLSAAIASYVTFNARQEVTQSLNDFMVALRTAQTRATTGDKPTGCVQLLEYQISAAKGANIYYLNAICTDGNHNQLATYHTRGQVIMDNSIAVDVRFQVITGVPDPVQGNNTYYLGNKTLDLCVNVNPAPSGKIGYTGTLATCAGKLN